MVLRDQHVRKKAAIIPWPWRGQTDGEIFNRNRLLRRFYSHAVRELWRYLIVLSFVGGLGVVFLERSWAAPGRCLAVLGPLRDLLAALGAILGASWAFLGSLWALLGALEGPLPNKN